MVFMRSECTPHLIVNRFTYFHKTWYKHFFITRHPKAVTLVQLVIARCRTREHVVRTTLVPLTFIITKITYANTPWKYK
jgi:hypothetical protein